MKMEASSGESHNSQGPVVIKEAEQFTQKFLSLRCDD